MWLDSETDVDYVNFGSVAESVAELVVSAGGRPLSIGVSGPWGAGKSSLIKLTRAAIATREPQEEPRGTPATNKFVFVEFNAWLYQGYDDARAALLETIAVKLAAIAEERQRGMDKVQDFLKRIDWFRLASLTAGSAVALALGLPPVGLFGQAVALVRRGRKDGVDDDLIDDTQDLVTKGAKEVKGLVKDKAADESPRQRIQALRDSFVAALAELDVVLVVLIDDLDRCLPETAVSTLEAIRLFLFLDGTAFVIAADDHMIKHAVKKHFDNPDDSLVTNYFDKLIQIPIRVPTLGTQEVRAYMYLLYVHNSALDRTERERIRVAVCDRLTKSWQGQRIDRAFVQSLGITLPAELVAQLDSADRLTTIMATASGIAGNPRLIKRFLNTLSVRMAVATRQGVAVDEAALAKLLLFERLAPPALYLELATNITNSLDGKPHILDDWEPANQATPSDPPAHTDGDTDEERVADAPARSGDAAEAVPSDAPSIPERWNTTFAREWLALPPRLADIDMRGALYVSREHLPVIFSSDGLSATAAELLEALLSVPGEAHLLVDRLGALSPAEHGLIFDRLLGAARSESEWGVPAILEALLVLAKAAPNNASSLAGFLQSRPAIQIQPDLIPRISDEAWAKDVMATWLADPEVSVPVKAAIRGRTGDGHVAR